MTTNELAEFCRNLALLRSMRDGVADPEKTRLDLQERLRAGRSRVQDVYRKAKDRLEAVLDYGRTALGEEEFERAKAEIDDAPPEEPKKRGRPAKKADADLPGQGDMFAEQAAEQARADEDARRAVDPETDLDLAIMGALRKGGVLSASELAEQLVCSRLDVSQRVAELEQQGKIRLCAHARSKWELVPEEAKTEEAPEAKVDLTEYLDLQIWGPRRRHARELLDQGPLAMGPFVRGLANRLGLAQAAVRETRMVEQLVAEGTIVQKGNKLAYKVGDDDPFKADTEEAPTEAPEEAPL